MCAQPYAKCCTNASPLQSGQDWNAFSKGNSCRGDGDKDYILKEVRVCIFDVCMYNMHAYIHACMHACIHT